MERTERLLDLVALFLDSKEPVSWAELRESFKEDYSGSDEAAERKFERDKAELLELGIPITYVQGDDERRDGYVVDREAYYLPEAGLTPEELAVLYAAGSAALASGAFPGSQDLAHALRKIGFFAGEQLPSTNVRVELTSAPSGELAGTLEQLWRAVSTHKFVELSYFSPRSSETTQRRVDPYGLALRRGLWSLVGYCHLRGDIRTFLVHRIRGLTVNAAKPKSPDFSVPQDFELDAYVANHPWQHRFHAPVAARLVLSGELAPLAASLFPASSYRSQDGGEGNGGKGTVEVELTATSLDGLVKYALSLGGECRLVAPPEAVQQLEGMARRIVAAHESSMGGSASPGEARAAQGGG